jgi:hypothetical protein
MKLFLFLISINLFANYAEKWKVDECIEKSKGKLVPPPGDLPTFKTCMPDLVCYVMPNDFSCIYFSSVQKEESFKVNCTDEIPENSTPTEEPMDSTPTTPSYPQCSPSLCPTGYAYSHNPKDTFATCRQTTSVLELDPIKKQNYDAMKADEEKIKASYQESQLYNNISDWCIYELNAPCSSRKVQTQKMINANQLKITDKIKRKLRI